MKIVKGFVNIQSLIKNNPGVNSTLGELTTWSETYSKEKGEYVSNNYPNYQLVTFTSVDTELGPIVTDQDIIDEIFSVVDTCMQYVTSHTLPYDKVALYNALVLSHINALLGLKLGNLVTGISPTAIIALPEWISWSSASNNFTEIKIWLADASFAEQYDEYSITAVSPLSSVDAFFNLANEVRPLISSITLPNLINKAELAKEGHPETYTRVIPLTYTNPYTPTLRLEINWVVLIYGKQGDNIDTIYEAIIDYILSHSSHTREEWVPVFTELFKRTQFLIVPRWDRVAIPNLSSNSELYSSIVNLQETTQFMIGFYPDISSEFIRANLSLVPHPYKSVMLCVLGTADNKLGFKNIEDIFVDYLPINTSSLDYNRMSIKTREWENALLEMLISAETITDYTPVPNNYRRIRRGNKLYISWVFDKIQYLVLAKSNFTIGG